MPSEVPSIMPSDIPSLSSEPTDSPSANPSGTVSYICICILYVFVVLLYCAHTNSIISLLM